MNGIAEIRQFLFHSVVRKCELLIYIQRGASLLGTSKNAIFQFSIPYKSKGYIGEKSQYHD